MTFEDLTKRFVIAQSAVNNINCGLLAGREKVRIERIYEELQIIWNNLAELPEMGKELTIVNYKKPE